MRILGDVCKIVHVEIRRDDEGRGQVLALLVRPDGSFVAVEYGGDRIELGRPRPRLAVPCLGPGYVSPGALPA